MLYLINPQLQKSILEFWPTSPCLFGLISCTKSFPVDFTLPHGQQQWHPWPLWVRLRPPQRRAPGAVLHDRGGQLQVCKEVAACSVTRARSGQKGATEESSVLRASVLCISVEPSCRQHTKAAIMAAPVEGALEALQAFRPVRACLIAFRIKRKLWFGCFRNCPKLDLWLGVRKTERRLSSKRTLPYSPKPRKTLDP